MTVMVDPNFHFTADDIAEVELPQKTRSYCPVGHRDFRDSIVEVFSEAGHEIGAEGYHMRKEGNILLGMLVLKPQSEREERSPMTIMMRNSYDKSFSAGLAIGPSVSYCLNMCISGSDVTYLRKHTKNVWSDLYSILTDAAHTSRAKYLDRLDEIERLEALPIDTESGYGILGRLYGNEILLPRMFGAAVTEWNTPRFEEFEARNAWSLYNAVTWGIKAGNPIHVPKLNPKAHEFFASLIDVE